MKILYLSLALLFMVSTAHADETSYSVQVSRCVQLESAVHVYDTLTPYKTARIEKVSGAYLVTVGSFRSRAKVESLLAQLKKGHSDAFIRKFSPTGIQVVRGHAPAKSPGKAASESTPPARAVPATDEKPSVDAATSDRADTPAVLPKKKRAGATSSGRNIPPDGPDKPLRPQSPSPPAVSGAIPSKPRGTGVYVPSVRNIPPAKTDNPLRIPVIPPPVTGGDAPVKAPGSKGSPAAPSTRRTPAGESPAPQSKTEPSSLKEEKPSLPKVSASTAEDQYRSGVQSYRDFRYDETIGFLSRYMSLSPNGSQCSAALFIMGKSFEALNRPLSALGIFGRILEQYPQSPEAFLSILAMADIGVAQPTLSYPPFMSGAEYFRNPILAYDTALTKQVPAAMIEDTLLQKGRAFWKQGHHKESYDTFARLLKEFPKTPYRKESLDILKAATAILIDRYHQSGDHLATAEFYFKAKGKGFVNPDDMGTITKSALSLAHLGFYDDSLGLVTALKTNAPAKALPDIDKAVQEIETIRTANASVQLPENANWALFQSGREYLRANNIPLAEQTLSKLKNEGGEPFWSRITDYALADGKWSQKYRATADGKH